MAKTDKSQKLQQLAQQVIPGGVNSPVRAFKSVGGTPRFIKRGEGAYLFDVDGNKLFDFGASWGPLIFGHADPDVVQAVANQAANGMTFGASTEVEYKLAKLIVDRIDWVEKIRFVSSGTEAVMSAIRLARGFTGRDLILKFAGCYHGHSDYLLVEAGSGLATFGQPSSAGVPEAITSQTAVLPLDNEDLIKTFFDKNGDKLAAVIIEGIPANNGLLVQRQEYIQTLRNLCEKHGALFIFDEVITGFRVGFDGAAAQYGITPDLVTYGKIIGGGMPVGAFGGRAEIMNKLSPDGPVYQAGTLSGNPIAMTAGLATLNKLADGQQYKRLDNMTQAFTRRLLENVKNVTMQIVREASIFWIVFQDIAPRSSGAIDANGIKRFNAIHGPTLDAGIYLPPSGYEVCFVSAVHTDEMLKDAADRLAGIINEKATT